MISLMMTSNNKLCLSIGTLLILSVGTTAMVQSAYAAHQQPSHPPATDPKSQGHNVGSCSAHANEPGADQGLPVTECREDMAGQAGRGDNNPEGCYELPFISPGQPNTGPDGQQNGAATFWCGAPPN